MKQNLEIEHAAQFEVSQKGSDLEAKKLLHELNVAFEQFKHANDERIDQLEKKQSEDIVTVEKVDRLNDRITQLSCDLRKPPLSGQSPNGAVENREEKAAFVDYLQSGHIAPSTASGAANGVGGAGIETRALRASSDADGGYFVPESIEARISDHMANTSLRALAHRVQISNGNSYRQLVPNDELGSSWSSDTGTRSQTTTSGLNELSIPVHEIYANPAATTTLLEDSAIDVEQWFVETINRSFHEKESQAFISGTGVNQPKGILSYTTHSGTSGAWNKIMYGKTGNNVNFMTTNPHLRLIDLIYRIKPVYRQNSHWVMNQNTLAKIRKMKDDDNHHIWAPPSGVDQMSRVLGYPVFEESNMPDVSANKLVAIFGDFKAGYAIVERLGTQILRDPFSSKPYVLFYTTRRIGGGVQDFNALCALKVAA